MRSKRLAIVILGTISIVLLVGVMPVMAKTISWRMQSLYPATDLSTSLQGQTIVDTLNKRLAGKLQRGGNV